MEHNSGREFRLMKATFRSSEVLANDKGPGHRRAPASGGHGPDTGRKLEDPDLTGSVVERQGQEGVGRGARPTACLLQ